MAEFTGWEEIIPGREYVADLGIGRVGEIAARLDALDSDRWTAKGVLWERPMLDSVEQAMRAARLMAIEDLEAASLQGGKLGGTVLSPEEIKAAFAKLATLAP